MLEEQRADPTIAVGEEAARRTAYELASTKGVRDLFRRCATVHEEWWVWFGAGRVPSALSKEVERDEKRKIRRKGLKEKIRERKRAVGDTVDATPEPVQRLYCGNSFHPVRLVTSKLRLPYSQEDVRLSITFMNRILWMTKGILESYVAEETGTGIYKACHGRFALK